MFLYTLIFFFYYTFIPGVVRGSLYVFEECGRSSITFVIVSLLMLAAWLYVERCFYFYYTWWTSKEARITDAEVDRNIAITENKLVFRFVTILIFLGLAAYVSNQPFFSAYSLVNFGPIMHFGADRTGLAFCLLTSTLYVLIAYYYGQNYGLRKPMLFTFFIVTGLIILFVCFLTDNFFVFYVAFESILIPFYFIVGMWGARINRLGAAFRLVFFTVFFSTPLTLIVFMNLYRNDFSFAFSEIGATIVTLEPQFQILFLIASFLAFAVKIPLFPIHVWLPEAHGEAPTFGSVLLAGILLKLGGYGFIKIFFSGFSEYSCFAAVDPFAMVYTISIITILYSNLVIFSQIDLKKIIAYYSIGHMGFVTLGLATNTREGLLGAIVVILSHGLSASLLFFLVGFVYEQTHTRSLLAYRGLSTTVPIFSIALFFAFCANASLPGTANFVGEQLVIIGLTKFNEQAIVLPILGVILNGISSFLVIIRVLFGESTAVGVSLKDISRPEKTIVTWLLLPLVVFGFFPTTLIDFLNY